MYDSVCRKQSRDGKRFSGERGATSGNECGRNVYEMTEAVNKYAATRVRVDICRAVQF